MSSHEHELWGEVTSEAQGTNTETVYRPSNDPIAMVIATEKMMTTPPTPPYYNGNQTAASKVMNIITNQYGSDPEVDASCIETAKKVRRYYKNKFLKLILGDKRPSNFRTDTYNVLIKPVYDYFKIDELKILVKLYDFYQEDCALDELEEKWSYDVRANTLPHTIKLENETITNIKIVKSIHKGYKHRRYFFTDRKDRLLVITVDDKNPLIHLLDHCLGDSKTLTITGDALHLRIIDRNLLCHQLTDWRISNE